jgi:hypothetical protein
LISVTKVGPKLKTSVSPIVGDVELNAVGTLVVSRLGTMETASLGDTVGLAELTPLGVVD